MFIFEPSQLCNCRCSFCYHWKEYGKDHQKELAREEIFDILKQAYELGCSYLLLNGGEPTIAKYFEDTLRKAKEIGYSISITTNGSTLKEKAEFISRYVDNITVSIDFPDKRHDEYRKLNGLFDRAIEGIKEAKKYIKNIKINYSIHKKNKECIEDMAKLAKELGIGIFFRMLIAEHKTDASLSRLVINNEDEIKQIANLLIKLKKDHPIVSSYTYLKFLKDIKPFRCRLSRFIINIDAQGRVYCPCPLHEGTKDLIYGSIREKKLKEIWYNNKANNFRKFSLKCKPCLNCYTACFIEASQIIKPDFKFWLEQAFQNSHFKQFFD